MWRGRCEGNFNTPLRVVKNRSKNTEVKKKKRKKPQNTEIVIMELRHLTVGPSFLDFFFFFSFVFISWRLITLQYCSGFCHTLT